MTSAPIPTKRNHAHHKRLTLQHSKGVPDRENVSALSDFELIDRLNMQMKAKPIPSDPARTARSTTPIPTQVPARFFPTHPYKV